MAAMLDIINVASITIALPSILRDVGYQSNQLQWYVKKAREPDAYIHRLNLFFALPPAHSSQLSIVTTKLTWLFNVPGSGV
jgi:hypothetical protein